MSSAVGNYGGSQINFVVPQTPGVTLTESSGHTPAPKRRHVKCDEEKPSCRRCVKWQGFCEGYTTGGSSASTPGPDSDLDGASPATRASKSPPAEERAALPVEVDDDDDDDDDDMFRDPTERRYFDHWLAYKDQLGGGVFDEPLWSETVPRMCRQHASVRYAAMAVGGIAKAPRRSLNPMSPAQMGANGPHYALALSYYGSAIREIRKEIHRAEMDIGSLRATIVCCLLFVCFEALHGDRRAALSHIDNGRKMMDELLRRRCGEEEEAEESRLFRSVMGAESFETDALHVFQRLIQQSWSCGQLWRRDRHASEELRGGDNDEAGQEEDHSERSWCCRGGPGGERAFRNMPSSFATLQEARRWFDVTQHYATHSSDCNERAQGHVGGAEMGGGADGSERRRGSEDALERWHDAFAPLWDAARENRDGGDGG
ncbi:hypothetical protein LX36DRAFT_553382, partial [Colletotrichum falcatum]